MVKYLTPKTGLVILLIALLNGASQGMLAEDTATAVGILVGSFIGATAIVLALKFVYVKLGDSRFFDSAREEAAE